jgi:hypothetical protein
MRRRDSSSAAEWPWAGDTGAPRGATCSTAPRRKLCRSEGRPTCHVAWEDGGVVSGDATRHRGHWGIPGAAATNSHTRGHRARRHTAVWKGRGRCRRPDRARQRWRGLAHPSVAVVSRTAAWVAMKCYFFQRGRGGRGRRRRGERLHRNFSSLSLSLSLEARTTATIETHRQEVVPPPAGSVERGGCGKDLSHSTSSSSFEFIHAAFDFIHAAFDFIHAAFDFIHAAFDFIHAAFDFIHAAFESCS